MNDDQSTPAFSLGVIVGGTSADSRAWGDAVMELARTVIEERAQVESALRVNLVFQVPGEVLPVDFSGVRTGRYSRNERLLLIQAAVPQSPVPLDPKEVLLPLIADSIELAEKFAQRKGIINGRLESLRSLAMRLSADSGFS
ncbi:hypothetical protein [Rhodoglobus sp.]